MIEIIWDASFKRKYKKLKKSEPDVISLFWNQLELFTVNPFSPALKTHKLSGRLKNYWAFSINYSYRVTFRFIDDNNVLLIEIGTHDEVY